MSKGGDIASKMRHKIIFQNEVLAADGAGGNAVSWSNFATVWAKIEDLGQLSARSINAEKGFAGQLQNECSYKITIRYLGGVTPKMRALFGSRVFNIRSVINVNEENEILLVFAEEGVAV